MTRSRRPLWNKKNGSYVPPGDFPTWHDLYREYYKGLAEHLKLPRQTRGNFVNQFCERHKVSRFEVNRLQKAYRMTYMEDNPFSEKAQEYFEEFFRGDYGPDVLRMKVEDLALQAESSPDSEVYRSAMLQIAHHLNQIRVILRALKHDIPGGVTDEEVHNLAREIWVGRQELTGWYNRKIRKGRPQVLTRTEGKRP